MISRGTTPTYVLTLPDNVDLTNASLVYVTFADTFYKSFLEKTQDDITIDHNVVEVFLTQEETLTFPLSEALVQINWITADGKRVATEIKSVYSAKNLKEVKIE